MGKRVCKEYDVRIGKQDHGPVRYRRELSNPLGLFSGDVLQISFGIVQDRIRRVACSIQGRSAANSRVVEGITHIRRKRYDRDCVLIHYDERAKALPPILSELGHGRRDDQNDVPNRLRRDASVRRRGFKST